MQSRTTGRMHENNRDNDDGREHIIDHIQHFIFLYAFYIYLLVFYLKCVLDKWIETVGYNN